MAINFRKIATQQTILSDLMDGRTKVSKTDGTIHISDFDIVPDKKGVVYAICAINDKEFINGGHVLTKIFTSIIEVFSGDKEKAREEFRASGGLDVKLTRQKTQSGHDITTVEVL